MLLSSAELDRMYSLERELRNHYLQLETLFNTRLTQGLLLNYAGYYDGRNAGILSKNTGITLP
jgi:hypothetical protein